jgi:hypothetical protein
MFHEDYQARKSRGTIKIEPNADKETAWLVYTYRKSNGSQVGKPVHIDPKTGKEIADPLPTFLSIEIGR